MNRFLIIGIYLLIFMVSCKTKTQTTKDKDAPNILILLADDLGYGELGCYGQETILTPNLDNLAKQGMLFTDFYSGNAVCSPSRAVLMTGISSSYNNVRGNSGFLGNDLWDRIALDKNDITMGELLKKAGYRTAYIGKWHLDDPNDLSTWAFNRGYDFAVQEQWGSRFGGNAYDEEMHWINGKQDSVYYHWKEWECKDDFRTTMAINYLDTLNNEDPFLLFMSFRAPHGHEREIGNKELYKEKGWPEAERLHAAKITLLDKQIGRLLAKLEEIGELHNTLILFSSDNGPHQEGAGHKIQFFNSNGPLRGYKRDLYEGGIRVPLIAVWDGVIKKNVTTNFVAGFQDIVPTLAQVAGVDIPKKSNGISILPLFKGVNQPEHNSMSWEFQLDGWGRKMPQGGFRQAVRLFNWKGVRYGLGAQTELYDLNNDLSENNNIASENPDIIKEINDIFEQRVETIGFPLGGVTQDYKAKDRYKFTEEQR